MKTFDKLENRYIFKGTLSLSEAMHIGSGEGDERVDSTFARNRGKCYIPGSSLRGALRSTVERIIATLGGYSCVLSKDDGSKCITVCRDTQKAFQELVEKGEKESKLADWLEKDGHLCDTCRLFGSTHFASKVKITDLHLKGDNNPQGVKRTGIGIDRDTETASEGALFDIEVLEKGHEFEFELIAENLEGNDFNILAIGLQEMLRDSFYIGAKSATGLGRCKLTDLQINYFDNSDPTYTLKKYLLDDEMKTILKSDSNGWLKEKVKTYLFNGAKS